MFRIEDDPEIVELGPTARYGHAFGMGTLSDVLPLHSSEDEVLRHTYKLGWSNGCPIAKKLLTDAVEDPNAPYDLPWMVNRYAETNAWFRIIENFLREKVGSSSPLYKKVCTPQTRLPFDPKPWIFDDRFVPASHLDQIAPMSGLPGYASSRMLIEVRGRGDQKRDFGKPLEVLRQVISKPKYEINTAEAFLAEMGERVVHDFKVDAAQVLSHLYPAGVLKEEGCRAFYGQLYLEMSQRAQTVFGEYEALGEKGRKELEVAEYPGF